MDTYENIKEGMALCTGTRTKGYAMACRGQLLRCTGCGSTGCRQTTLESCTAQGFDVAYRCVKCSTTGQYEALPLDYAQTQPWLNAEQSASH